MLFLLLICILLGFFGSSAGECLEQISTNRIILSHYRYVIIDGNQHYVNWQDIPANATITCSNIYSLGQISYLHKNHNYDQFLIIENSNISAVNSLELHKFKTLRKIYLNNSHIQNIFSGAFSGLTNLTELYLNDNKLTEISNGVFNTLHSLKVLNLTNNNIHKIDTVALVGLSNLTNFYFRKNNLENFSGNYLETLTRLEYLDLAQNPLGQFAFEKILNMSIKYLYLAGTNLKEMSCDLSNLNFVEFDLSDSKMSQIDFRLFPKCDKTVLSENLISVVENCDVIRSDSLDLRSNKICEINCVFPKLSEIYLGHNKLTVVEKSKFSAPQSLLVLDLSHNLLKNLSKTFFDNFTSLQILKLSGNQFSDFGPDFFHNLAQLTHLDLSGNQITKIPFGVFDNLHQLESLNISVNNLSDLHQLTFNSLENLRELYFDYNRISSVDVADLRQHLPKLKQISVNYNPWNCESLIKIYKFLKTEEVNILSGNSYDVENFHGIACRNSKSGEISRSTSDLSYQKVAEKMQKAINDGIANSKLDFLFNENFQQSKFVQYFDKDYSKSNFFKYLNNMKFLVTHADNLNVSKTEKFTAFETVPEESSSGFLVFISVLLAIMTFMLLSILYVNFKMLQTLTVKKRPQSSSEIELC